MSELSKSNRKRTALIIFTLIGVAAALIVLGRDGNAPSKEVTHTTPNSLPAPQASEEANASGPEMQSGALHADTQEQGDLANESNGGQSDPSLIRKSSSAADSRQDEGLNPEEAERIDRAIARAQAVEAVKAGILAAQANPGPPPAIANVLRRAPPVAPIELDDAPRQGKNTPPEILEMMREERGTPPEIAQAMAEAQERGTSDAMRAYMAGETDERPEY